MTKSEKIYHRLLNQYKDDPTFLGIQLDNTDEVYLYFSDGDTISKPINKDYDDLIFIGVFYDIDSFLHWWSVYRKFRHGPEYISKIGKYLIQ